MTKKAGRKRKDLNPVDVALAKKKKVSLSDTDRCKYCGKSYCSGKKLTDHINMEHTAEQTILLVHTVVSRLTSIQSI